MVLQPIRNAKSCEFLRLPIGDCPNNTSGVAGPFAAKKAKGAAATRHRATIAGLASGMRARNAAAARKHMKHVEFTLVAHCNAVLLTSKLYKPTNLEVRSIPADGSGWGSCATV